MIRAVAAVEVPRRRPALGILLVLLVGVVAGCGGPAGSPAAGSYRPVPADVVRVGSADSPEDRLLGEIYATGLQIRGVAVERRFGVGDREAYLPLLRDGTVDLVPEHTGELLAHLDPRATVTEPDAVYRQARTTLPPSLTLLDEARAQDKDVIVVTRAFSVVNNVRSLADLAPLCPTVVIAGPRELSVRASGLPGLQRTYGCSFRALRPGDAGDPRALVALRDGQVQAAVLPSTDTAIPANDLVALDDPRAVVSAQNVVPLITAAKTADPRVTEVLNKISSQLDTAVLTDLDRRLAGPDGLTAAQVARDWLASAGVG